MASGTAAPGTPRSGGQTAPAASLSGALLRPKQSAKQPTAAPGAISSSPEPAAPGFRVEHRILGDASSHRVPTTSDPAPVIAWWEGLKRGRPFPAPADLDQAAIGAAWLTAVLLSYSTDQGGIARATRLGDRDEVRFGVVEYTPMLTEWLLTVGRLAVRRGVPVHETRSFPSARGMADYGILALPLSADGHGIDHVLCRLGRA